MAATVREAIRELEPEPDSLKTIEADREARGG